MSGMDEQIMTIDSLIAWRWEQAKRLWPNTTDDYKRKWWSLMIGGDIDSRDIPVAKEAGQAGFQDENHALAAK